MSASDAFTGRLLGYHDVRENGGALLPRRNTLNFANAIVEDRDGETRITLVERPVWLPVAALGSGADDYSPAGFARCTDVPVTADASAVLSGLNSTGLVTYSKRIWNRNASEAITLPHLSTDSASGNRFVCPGAAPYTLAADSAVKALWSSTDSGWRLIQCLA